ncbi:MAG: crotonase/enoyl-CoA hydratase family protein [Hyphomicrobiales bacterium]
MSVRIEKEDPVWTIIHSRPEARNAMDPESTVALYNAFLKFDADDDAKVAVFWGEGGAFCAGWDLKHASSLSGAEALNPFDFPEEGSSTPKKPSMAAMGPSRLELSKPVIAAVAGPAVAGGMELALWCDIRVMEETAFMGVYCRRWGIPLIDGGTVRLPRLVGEGRAMDLILTGRRVDAEEALRIGLCEYIALEGNARAKAEALAHDIARFPQNCMLADRRSVRSQHGLSLQDALRQEWQGSKTEVTRGIEGAERFASGKGRSGDFEDV